MFVHCLLRACVRVCGVRVARGVACMACLHFLQHKLWAIVPPDFSKTQQLRPPRFFFFQVTPRKYEEQATTPSKKFFSFSAEPVFAEVFFAWNPPQPFWRGQLSLLRNRMFLCATQTTGNCPTHTGTFIHIHTHTHTRTHNYHKNRTFVPPVPHTRNTHIQRNQTIRKTPYNTKQVTHTF